MKDGLPPENDDKNMSFEAYIDEDYGRSQALIKANRELFRQLIQSLVDAPSEVEVLTICGEHTVIFEVWVGQADIRRIIGRKGRTADALRQILLNLGSIAGKRYILEIVEPESQKKKSR